MDKRDSCTITPETQEEIRCQVIRSVESGMKAKDVAKQLEVSRKSIHEWKRIYKNVGMKALKAKKQCRSMGSGLKLSEAQQEKIRLIICDATPEQLKMRFALWTREAVKSLMGDLFKIKMERRRVGRYLKRWGFTPQRPVKRAYECND